MQEVFYTVLVIWLLFRVFGGSSRIYVHHSMKTGNRSGEKNEETGKVTIEKKQQGKDTQTEYTDFEEIKD